jgi:fumarate reductase subunit C
MSARRPYVRSMAGWWRRDPYFLHYMLREATAVFVAAYGVILLFGLIRLNQGEAAYQGWLQALKSPWSILFHCLVFATFVYHTWSWFRIMPKTMPMIMLGGNKLKPAVITGGGLAAAVVACASVLAFALGVRS